MLNILIRTSNRPKAFQCLLDSIASQTFKNIRLIVSYDNDIALTYVPEHIEKVKVFPSSKPFFYDDYVNDLKSLVNEGWFVVIDDDEVLADNTCLERVYKELKGKDGLICQFSRNGRLKPSNESIKNREVRRSRVGMPCLLLHHSFKNLVDLDGSVGAADYTWIKTISRKVKLKFVPIVVAFAAKRGNGQME